MSKGAQLFALICLGLANGCATPTLAGPAWYCTGTALVDEVQGLSTANLNADGTVSYASREWNYQILSNDRVTLLITGSGDEFRIGVLRPPKTYFKSVYRVEIRFDSVDSLQQDPSLGRDDPRNGSNVYTFRREGLLPHKSRRAFFVALDRDGRVWWSVPLDLSIIDRGESAMELADAKLSTMRADFSKRCGRRDKVVGIVVV